MATGFETVADGEGTEVTVPWAVIEEDEGFVNVTAGVTGLI